MEKIDVQVIQKPVSVNYECPNCSNDIEIDYVDFCDTAGEVCDWRHTEIQCPECGVVLEVDDNEWI